MSAQELRPMRPRPLARIRQRIPRQPWGVPSRLEPQTARENSSGVGGLGGLDINQCRVATWELHPVDSRGAPTRGLYSIPECDMGSLGEEAARTTGRGS